MTSEFGQIAAKAVERRRFRFARFLAAATAAAPFAAAATFHSATFTTPFTFHAVAQKAKDFLAHVFQFQSQVHQHLRGHAFLLAQQAEQNVLGAHIVVIQVAGFFHRILDDLLGPRRLRQLAHCDHVGSALDELFDFEANLAQVDVQVLQHIGGHATAFFDQPQQHVFGADVFMVESLGFLIGQLHDLASTIGKAFVHGYSLMTGLVYLCRAAAELAPRFMPARRAATLLFHAACWAGDSSFNLF